MECFKILRFTRYIQPCFYALKNPNGKSGLKSDRIDSKENSLGIFQKTSPAVWKRLFEFIKTMDDEGLGRLDLVTLILTDCCLCLGQEGTYSCVPHINLKS